MRKLYHLPSTGQIVGDVFKILRVPYPQPIKKDVQRYFLGHRIHDTTREEILYALVDRLLDDGILPPEPLDPLFECRWALKKQLIRGITEYAQKWDSICAKLRYWSIPFSQKEHVLVTILRLAVVDLAFRTASYRYLARLPKLHRSIPLWAKRGGSITYLRELKSHCSVKPSNSELAAEAGVTNEKTLAAWFFRGKKPSAEHLRLLAEAFTRRIPGADTKHLLAEMNRHYIFAALCK